MTGGGAGGPRAARRRAWMRLVAALVVVAGAMTGCDRQAASRAPDPSRCARCGMRVDLAPEFRAGATDRDGREVAFDAPKCLFRWMKSPAGEGARDPWVTEYYGQSRQPVDEVVFVVGSDVVGPMGHDLVPVGDRDAADRFLGDHDGDRIVDPGDVDAALLDALDGPGDDR